MKFKKQHYVPKTYLMSWCDKDCPENQDPFVWMYTVDGETVKRKSPKNIFHQSDFYTIYDDNGGRILDVEHGLSGLEDKFAAIRDNKLLKKEALSDEETNYILLFIAAMHHRTLAMRNHFEGEWDKLINFGEELKQAVLKMPPEARESLSSIGKLGTGKSYTLSEMKHIQENSIEELMLPRIKVEFQIYRKMYMSFLITDDEVGFITSDNPCVTFDPEAYKRPAFYQVPGLGYKSVEITMPVSPSVSIIISHKKLPTYIHVKQETVDSINRKTRFYASEYYIVNKRYKNEFWFKHIDPPKQ